MIVQRRSASPATVLRRLLRDDRAATMVEFALVIGLVLILFFAILDFGRVGYTYVAAQKAVQNAARLAVVNPLACPGTLPAGHTLKTSLANAVPPYEFGTPCGISAQPCTVEAAIICNGTAGNPTAAAIHGAVRSLLPSSVGVDGLRYSYTHDARLGFLGGPYTPMVTVALVDPADVTVGPTVQLISPLGRLLQLVGGDGTGPFDNGNFRLPVISVSMPGEDLG